MAKGDTLQGIAMTSGVSAADLARWNKLSDPNQIRIGQELQLSGSGK